MNEDKSRVSRIPISSHTRFKNRLGKGAVPCIISGRWLLFPKESEHHPSLGECIDLKVMTTDGNEQDRKLCELIITKEDLLDAINSIKTPPTDKG